ncbi:hypothetical protein QF000_005507 [Paraburkholderia atlantica]|uniref:hypothetical protein n=1 Tax=Paraburkholderia atlantica TaxID=2654982 RepID=UPI003D1C41FB
MPTAFEAASSITRWALARNLIAPLPAGMEEEYVAGVLPANFNAETEDILRRRSIVSIAFNDASAEVLLYTSKRLFQRELDVLPDIYAGCRVTYSHGAVDDLGNGSAVVAHGASYALFQGANDKFYTCGSSVSPGNEASAGTLGALVRDAAGKLFGLTNNHVTGGCNHSEIGLPIVAPGIMDVSAGALNPFTLGVHDRVIPYALGTSGNVSIADNTDAALFEIVAQDRISSMQGTIYDTPTNVIAPADGMVVQKVGRTTRHTTGKIVGRFLRPIRVGASSSSNGFSGHFWFPGAWIVHSDTNNVFPDSGDSGSLVVTTDANGVSAAVGLIFAGGPDTQAPGGKMSCIVPIAPILAKLGVTLVGGHNIQ